MSRGATRQQIVAERVESFQYPVSADAPLLPDWKGWGEGADVEDFTESGPRQEAALALEQKLAEETRRAFEAGRERGLHEGRQAERETQDAAIRAARERQMAGLVESFAAERGRYLQAVESEVVKLALAIAARILRREAQMDPLLLTGAVRVALGQLSASTQVRLRVPNADLALWTEAIRLIPNLSLEPTFVGDGELHAGDCIVDTGIGSIDLGIRAQLAEIERGFFDRPGNSSRALPAEESRA